MSGSRRQRDSLAPSLFPFLAVLLCTMGALVLILMLIVAGAQTSAKEVATETNNRIEEAEALLEHAKRSFGNQLVEGRVALEKKRLILQHIEKHIQELLDELEDLKRTAELVEQDKSEEGIEEKDRQSAISALEKQLQEATKELEQKLDQPDGDKPIFAIIPYQGTNGTHRRPIYLECTAEGVVVQPEGVVIDPSDLRPPYGPGNPLDAALRTVRAEFPPSNGAVTSTAYPLLIVRPSGVRTYALARAAMSGWDDQFGYELINEELELSYPESISGLKTKLTKTLDLARERQAALVMAMPNKYRGRAGGDAAEFDDPSDWAEGEVGGAGGSLWDNSQGSGSNGSRGGYSLAERSKGAGQFTDSPIGAGQDAGFGAGSGQDNSGLNSSELAFNDQRLATDAASLFANGSSNSASSGANADLGATNSYSNLDGQVAMNGQGPTGGGYGPSSGNSDGTADASVGDPSGQQSTGGGGQTGSSATGGAQASAGGRQFELPFGSGGSSGSGSQSARGQSAGSASSSSAGGQASSSGSSSSTSEQAGTSPQLSPNSDMTKSHGESAQPVARSRGRGWAWSQGPQTETPVVRSIRLQCLNDRWLVMPDRGSTLEPTTISFDSSPRERAEQLAKVVLDRVQGWGLALTGGYWKPVLVVDVAPDAGWRYDQLRQLLDGSGLEVQLQADRGTTLRR
jgi:hypothetical protein